MSEIQDPWNLIKGDIIAKNLGAVSELSSKDVRALHLAQLELLPVIACMKAAALDALAHAKPRQLLAMETPLTCKYAVMTSREPVRVEVYREELVEHGVVMALAPELWGTAIEKVFPAVEFGDQDDPDSGLLVFPRTLIAMEDFIRNRQDVLTMVHCVRPDNRAQFLPSFDIGEMRH